MLATLGDSEEDVNDSEDESSQGKCIAFLASHMSTLTLSHDDEDTCACDTPEEVLSFSSEPESELQIAFRELAETLKQKKLNNKLGLKVKDLKREIESLKEFEAKASQLEKVKVSLSEQLIALNGKRVSL